MKEFSISMIHMLYQYKGNLSYLHLHDHSSDLKQYPQKPKSATSLVFLISILLIMSLTPFLRYSTVLLVIFLVPGDVLNMYYLECT